MNNHFTLVHFKPLGIIAIYPFYTHQAKSLLEQFSEKVGEKITDFDTDVHQLNNGTLYQIVETTHHE